MANFIKWKDPDYSESVILNLDLVQAIDIMPALIRFRFSEKNYLTVTHQAALKAIKEILDSLGLLNG